MVLNSLLISFITSFNSNKKESLTELSTVIRAKVYLGIALRKLPPSISETLTSKF